MGVEFSVGDATTTDGQNELGEEVKASARPSAKGAAISNPLPAPMY